MPHSFSVIIVTWNALEHLQTFLPSVTQSEYEDFEIIIADNASADRSTEWIRSTFPECSIISYPKNYGYCGGNNRAADHAKGEILVFLNNDVEVSKPWLKHLAKAFDDPDVGAVQPKFRSYINRDCFEYAGAAGGFLDSMGYPFCRGRIFNQIEKDRGQYDDPAPVFWASGAALAVRKNLFIKLGRFDEDFGFHMEEIDLCWRMLNRGYKVRFCPESVVYHLGAGSLPMDSSMKTYFNFRNSLYMLWKNASTQWLRKRFFPRLLLDGAAAGYALLKGNFGDTAAIFKAHLHFYANWFTVHKKRKALQNERTAQGEPSEMIDTVVVKEYFLKRRKTFNEVV